MNQKKEQGNMVPDKCRQNYDCKTELFPASKFYLDCGDKDNQYVCQTSCLPSKHEIILGGSRRCLRINLRNSTSTEIKCSGKKRQTIFLDFFFFFNLILPCKQETIQPSGTLASQQSQNCNERRISKLFHNCVWMKHVFTVCK